MKKLVAMILTAAVFCNAFCIPAAAEDVEPMTLVTGSLEYGLAVRIEDEPAEITQIGAYPVTAAPDHAAVSIQLTPFAEKKQMMLDMLHSQFASVETLTEYDAYVGERAVLPQSQITGQVYCLTVSGVGVNPVNFDEIYRDIINSIAADSDMTYLGKAVQVVQCDRYGMSEILVNAPVSDETEALLTTDERFVIDEGLTEYLRRTEPDVYVLAPANEAEYADFLAYKENLEAKTDGSIKVSFSVRHIALYCPHCRVGYEIYQPNAVRGDMTGDEAVDAADAQLVLEQYTAGISGTVRALSAPQNKTADVNGDNQVSVEDAQFILNYYVETVLSGNDVTWDDILGNTTK